MSEPNQGPNLGLVFGALTGYQRTGAVKAAIELDLFTAIGEGATTVPALAKRCQAAERGIRILADTMAVHGLLDKNGASYALTPTAAAFLDRNSPMYAAAAVEFLCNPTLVDGFMNAAAAVRKGGTAMPDEGTTSTENPIWVQFARAMSGIMGLQAQLVANLLDPESGTPWKVLDIAAGHGQFGIALARRNPRCEVVALDWKNVLVVAEENARAAGVTERFRKLPGSAFDVDYGSDYDIVLLPNFLHHFDAEGCHQVLCKIHACLKPGGRVVTVEFVPDESRISPLEAATFPMVMLVTTPAGDAYTFAELDAMFRRAGFARSELFEIPPAVDRVVISHR